MAKSIATLIVEDSESDTQLIVRLLHKAGHEITYRQVQTAEQMRAAVKAQAWDIVISDNSLPQFAGIAALTLLQELGPDIPFIAVSGTMGEETAVAMMRAGARDYLMKGNLARLVPAIERELEQAAVRRERKRTTEKAELFRALTDQANDAIEVLDPETGQFLDVNERGCLDLGYTREEFLALSVWDIDPAIDRSSFPGMVKDLRKQGVLLWEGFHRRKNGSTYPVEVNVRYVQLDRDYVVTVVRDTTQRKQAEEGIRRQLSQLAALHTIDQAIAGSTDVKLILQVILDQVISQLGADAADVLLYDPTARVLKYANGSGFRTRALKHADLPLGQGYPGQAASERQTVHIDNLENRGPEFLRARAFSQEGFVSYFGVPLIAKGKIKGVLEIFLRSAFDPEPEWLNFLDTLAGQAAIAMDNSVLFTDLQLSNVELAVAYDATIEGWSRAMDLRDKETEGHTQRVTEAALKLARALALPEPELTHVRRGALLHDMGKLGVPDAILQKPGPLTEEEWVLMRRHPQSAFDMLSPITYLKPALEIPYCHHEKWDGTGYPRGLKREQIPFAARIFAVVDVYDALTSDRPYRPAWTEEKAHEYIRSQSGTHFDPQVLETFFRMMGENHPAERRERT